MNKDCDVCQFLESKPLQNQILTTQYWTVGVITDQPYLGRALITLLTHKSSLGKLSSEEWHDFEAIVQKLEPAYKTAFGAEPLNIGCFMNHGYRDDPPHPHVHWHIFPRYRSTVEFGGQIFEDERYGKFYDDDARRPVDNEMVTAIADELRSKLD